MTVEIGFAATKVVNGKTVPDYAAEATNNNTKIGKMINATIEYLKRYKVPGINGTVGNYDATLLGECCHRIFNGAVTADTGYGIVVNRHFYETSNLL